MQYVVIANHTSNYPDPIHLTPGDPLVLGKTDDEYPGWIWVTTSSGQAGWAPEAYVHVHAKGQGEATTAYTSRELNTQLGEHLLCLQELNGWLWVENEQGDTGWVPKHTIGPL